MHSTISQPQNSDCPAAFPGTTAPTNPCPLRSFTGSIAASTRIRAVIWMIPVSQARRAKVPWRLADAGIGTTAAGSRRCYRVLVDLGLVAGSDILHQLYFR